MRALVPLLVVAVTIVASEARADQWATPTARTQLSPNRKLQAVIAPASDGRAGATATIGPTGSTGTTITLATTWMPVDTVLFDDGTLLALDHWHQLGFGQVATLYERDGKIRWQKTLVELLGPAFVDSAPRSVSSIWWRKTPLEHALAKDARSVLVTLHDENQLRIVLRDGSSSLVVVAQLPDDPGRLLNRARALANQDGQEPAALAALDRVLAKQPEHLQAALLYVQILQRTSDHARAVALLERVSPAWKTKDHEIANLCVAWAKSLAALSRPQDAERVLRRAIDAAPAYDYPVLALAALLFDRQRRKDGAAVLDAYVAQLVKSTHVDTYSLAAVGDFYRERNDRAKALAVYRKGYRKDEVTNQFLYASLAELHEELGHVGDAIRVHAQLLAHFQKLGSAFDADAKHTRAELARLRAKSPRP